MTSIIRRFDRAPLEDRILRANQAQPPRPKGALRPMGPGVGPSAGPATAAAPVGDGQLRRTRGGRKHRKPGSGPTSAFAEELAKAL